MARKRKKPKGKPFTRGYDSRRHKLTSADCSKGGKRTFQKLVGQEPPFNDPAVYAYVSVEVLKYYRSRSAQQEKPPRFVND